MSRVIRLPLQTGASALRDVTATTIIACIVGWFGLGVIGGGIGGGIASSSLTVGVVGYFVGFVIVSSALTAWVGGVVSARMHRASDLEIDADGLTVRGGRKDGLNVTFAELKPEHIQLEDAVSGAIRRYVGQTKYKRSFYLKTRDDIHLVAETAEDDEEASVRALAEAITARLEPDRVHKATARRPEVVACGSCGAPVVPVDADRASCAYCQATTLMPTAVRERLRGADEDREARAKLERVVAKIVAQPGATRINLALAIAGTLVSIACTCAPIGFVTNLPLASAALIATATASVLAARAQIESRRALRELTLGFAAPTDAKGASCCRRCAGGLPAGDAVVVRCVYCRSMNVRGLDFGRPGAVATTERELELDIARRRTRALLSWVGAAVFMTIAVGACVGESRRPPSPKPPPPSIHLDLPPPSFS